MALPDLLGVPDERVDDNRLYRETIEHRYGRSKRIWVMDRGMVSEDNIEFLREGGRRYIVGTPKSMLKKFEQEILKEDWHSIRDGLDVKIVPWPKLDEDHASTSESDSSPERFILCRSRERSKKEEGITQRSEKQIEEALTRMKARCKKQARDPMKVEREIGRMLDENSRAAKVFDVKVKKMTKTPLASNGQRSKRLVTGRR
jgi:transposase